MPPADDRPLADALTLAREAGAQADGATHEAPPFGDFADVLRRAAQQPGTRVSDQDIEDAERLATKSDAEIAAALAFGTIEDFLDDAAEFVAMQRVDEIPPMRALAPEAPPARRRMVAVMAVAAALVACTLGAAWLGRASWLAGRWPDGGATDYSAADRALGRGVDGAARAAGHREAPRISAGDEGVEGDEGVDAELRPEDGAVERLDDEGGNEAGELEAVDEATDRGADEGRSASAKSSRGNRAQRLQALDAEARAAWQRGDLVQAQRTFEALVRVAGRKSLADIAYGDLFSLARQRGDDQALRGYWKRYAKAFPRGRYIDEARAGLCRTASKDRRRACWEGYLRDRPQGTYHQHARDVLARSE